MDTNGSSPPAAAASSAVAAPAKPRKNKSKSEFWRAMWFVWPYRRTIATSVFCAMFVGIAMSCSLASLTPILNVLLTSQTIQQWADTTIAERRLGVRFIENSPVVQLAEVKADGRGAEAGLKSGDRLKLAGADGAALSAVDQSAGHVVADLARPVTASETATVRVERGDAPAFATKLDLEPLPIHLSMLRNVVGHLSPNPVWALAAIFGALASLAILGNTTRFFQEYLSDKVAVSAINDIRRKLYDHILHVPMAHFGRHGTNDVTSRLVQDSFALEAGFKTVLGQSVQQPIVVAFAFAIALWTNWKLTAVVILFVPVMAIVVRKFGTKMRRAARGAMQKNANMLGQIEGTLSGIRVVKAAGAERWERRRYRTIMRGLTAEQLRMSKIEAASSPIMETITLVVVGTIVLIATYMVTQTQTLSKSQFFVVMACLGTIGDAMRRLNKVNSVLQRGNAAASRIFEVIRMPVERRRELTPAADIAASGRQPRQLANLAPLAREVRFEDVSFAYPGASQPALDGVSLTVPKGRCVAVVGRNGSGKTTLLALLPRFYDPTSGRVTIDGVDVRDATLRSVRGQVSVVTQESIVFPGTIAENIAYGHPMAGQLRPEKQTEAGRRLRQEIEAAAKRAFAHEFILEKPKGYDTQLDGIGGQLSGGQRQRLCIARAILRKAPILILDEATSQVDAESEHLIQQAIDDLLQEGHAAADGGGAAPTIFVIAHRFSTITSADSIVVMDRGRIVGQGKHEELLQTCDVYQQLYERQLVAAPAG